VPQEGSFVAGGATGAGDIVGATGAGDVVGTTGHASNSQMLKQTEVQPREISSSANASSIALPHSMSEQEQQSDSGQLLLFSTVFTILQIGFENVGYADGSCVGSAVTGAAVGPDDGSCVGKSVGRFENIGYADGSCVGSAVTGAAVGPDDGSCVGKSVGRSVGDGVGH
jgi:hypothetical protein